MEKGFLSTILRQTQTVFTITELRLMWGGIDAATARKRISYYLQTRALYPIKRGLYGKDKDYDRYEMATKIFTPAYISFETVLSRSGVIFQYNSQIFVASYQSREMLVDGQKLVYRTLKPAILTNALGVIQMEHYAIASPERALLDIIYLNARTTFDQLSLIDWEKVFSILPVYGNSKGMQKRVMEYYNQSRL
jgi:predicted transcriptional regulator of viral defense system